MYRKLILFYFKILLYLLIIIIIINCICNAPFLNSKCYDLYKQITNQTKLHNIKNRITVINHKWKALLKRCILRSFLKQSKEAAFVINAGNAFHNLGAL